MAAQTLFLAWQGVGENRAWFPVGRLDADVATPEYRFRYLKGAERAQEQAGFSTILSFPELTKDYRSPELFPLFRNRVMNPARPDFPNYLKTLGLDGSAEPVEILAVNGGGRVTDSYEVFPKLVKKSDGSFTCRFLLHGSRHVNRSGQERLESLNPGDKLLVALELNNPETRLAVQIQTVDHQILGWTPHYLVEDLTKAMAESSGKYAAKVVRVNPQRHSLRPSLLVELSSYWDNHEPMSGPEYQPLVG